MQKRTLDDQKVDASIDLVRANAYWHRVMEKHGAFSDEAREAKEFAEKALRRFRRLQKR